MNTLYAYRCPFGHEVEQFFAFGDAPKTIACPDHQSQAFRLPARGSFLAVPGGYASPKTT